MVLHREKIRIVAICLSLSVLAHLLLLSPCWTLGSLNFAAPVGQPQAVMVDLARPAVDVAQAGIPVFPKARDLGKVAKESEGEILPEAPPAPRSETAPPTAVNDRVAGAPPANTTSTQPPAAAPPDPATDHSQLPAGPPPPRSAGEFLSTSQEKLSYRISMLGVAIGSAELEAKNQQGEVRITLKITSAPVISGVYPVDDLIETRHVAGEYIITRIRQHEGAVTRDKGFTIMSREKRVFWIDRLKNRSVTESIPNGDVVDIISGLYYLRNRPLQIGRTEMLHVYDSDSYSPLPVEVLRREVVRLPGFRKVDAIVIKPLLKTDGIFRRTGDVTIWLTDDDYKVPVKVETEIPLGKVTAELMSADTRMGAVAPDGDGKPEAGGRVKGRQPTVRAALDAPTPSGFHPSQVRAP